MSEYQYYEWQTLDRPLTPGEQAKVNGLSSHIYVTPSQAIVTYSWSDFKHDPIQVLAHYFDAFLYLANWGSKRLAFRFPKGVLDARELKPYLWDYYVELRLVGDHLILDISLDEEEGSDWIEGEGWLASLSHLRYDLVKGDYRMLYLAWLRVAELEDALEERPEPPVPPGLQELSPPLATFVELFDVDKYLLQAAAEASPPLRPGSTVPPEKAIALLSPAEREDFLVRLAHNEPFLSSKLNRRLQELTGVPSKTTETPQRTWGDLRERAAQLRREAKRRAAAAAEARRIRKLQALAEREDEVWREVVSLIEERKRSAYDKAVALLLDLRELAEFQGRMAGFQERVEELRQRYSRRSALQERLRESKLVR